ncbi:MAG: Ppx/GppA phosphatase family protein [Pseudomonadota bacterium]
MKEPDGRAAPRAEASTSGVAQAPKYAGAPDNSGEAVLRRTSTVESPHGSPPKKKRRRKRRRKKHAASAIPPVFHADQLPNTEPQHKAPEKTHRNTHQQARLGGRGLYAALDLGTNNCRLLIATPTKPGQFRVVDAFSRIVRLGEGLGHSGRLSEHAMQRALEALAICSDKLGNKSLRKARLIATEACRSADNGSDFLDEVKHRTGLELEVVDRETEARLAVSGCGSLVDWTAKSTVLFDIGGGSSEIAVISLDERKPRRLADAIVDWTSLPVGVVSMSEKFGGKHVDPDLFAQMKAYAGDLLAEFAEKHGGIGKDDNSFHLIGTSGTVTTLAGIHLDLPRYDRRRVDGLWINSRQGSDINDRILGWSFEQRKANVCIGADRADLVLAGCAILEAIRDAWPAKRLRVADRGLREGLLTEMMSDDGVWKGRRRRRRHRPNPNGQTPQ